jgi:hypothetical protein
LIARDDSVTDHLACQELAFTLNADYNGDAQVTASIKKFIKTKNLRASPSNTQRIAFFLPREI